MAAAGIVCFLLGVCFVVSTPWHVLWAPLNKAPVSKGFRQFLQQDWWQPPDAGADAESHSVNTSQYMSDGAAHRSHACRCTKRYPPDVCVHSHAGGHTENLGLLPVLQKRCSRIVCLDASADPTELCGSLIGVMDQARRYGRSSGARSPSRRRLLIRNRATGDAGTSGASLHLHRTSRTPTPT